MRLRGGSVRRGAGAECGGVALLDPIGPPYSSLLKSVDCWPLLHPTRQIGSLSLWNFHLGKGDTQ
jgi:hypothetical protein